MTIEAQIDLLVCCGRCQKVVYRDFQEIGKPANAILNFVPAKIDAFEAGITRKEKLISS